MESRSRTAPAVFGRLGIRGAGTCVALVLGAAVFFAGGSADANWVLDFGLDDWTDMGDVADAPELNPQDSSFSIEFWTRYPEQSGWSFTVHMWSVDPDSGFISIRDDGLMIDMDTDGETFRTPFGDNEVPHLTDQWVFVQAVQDRDSDPNMLIMRMYDGDQWHEASVETSSGETNWEEGPLQIPIAEPDVSGYSYEWSGRLSEVRFWHTARGTSDAEADMFRRLSGSESDLVAYWPMNEGSGGTAHDESGHGIHGEIHGGEWVQDGDLPIVHVVDVEPDPTITVAPDGETELGPVLLHEDYEDDATFQWYFEGEELEGETGSGLFIDAATVEQAGIYTVIVNHPDFDDPIAEYDIELRVQEVHAPAAGVLGLGVLAGALALAGGAAHSIRRMRG